MTIDDLDVFRLGSATADGSDDAILVRLSSDGASGWGEAAIDDAPVECEQWTLGTLAFLEHCLAPAIVGSAVESAEALAERLNRFRGHSLGKGAIDCAWRDLAARREGKPLWQALGGTRAIVPISQPFGVRRSIDELLAEISAAVERGAAEITLKLRPGWGIDVVRAVRGTFATLAIRVDFDGSASLDQRDLLFRLQDYQVAAIEQPLDADDLVGHAMLQESLRTPICLDQSVTSPARARMALDLGSCQQIRVRADYSGGLTAALDIAAACREAHAACVVGCRASTEVGLRHAAALAMRDSVAPGVELDDGDSSATTENAPKRIDAWSEAGIGTEPDERTLRLETRRQGVKS